MKTPRPVQRHCVDAPSPQRDDPACRRQTPLSLAIGLSLATMMMVACSSDDDDDGDSGSGGDGSGEITQLAPATPGTRTADCATLTDFDFAETVIEQASVVAEGSLMQADQAIGEHCLVTGYMNERTSEVDGLRYAIGFEMRLPTEWNGRYWYQANGGIDGSVRTATGDGSGGGPLTGALHQGFAVISSDAGHQQRTPTFGYDPQARLDYGYQAVGTLTPMAKALVEATYGRGPDRSYIGGCSNGGRHALVAATRYTDDYDGYLIGAPGFNLPQAALANIGGAQAYAAIPGTDTADLSTAITKQERQLVADAIVSRCDTLDGAEDGMVLDVASCQSTFDIDTDVPLCTGERDGSCLTTDQKSALSTIYNGVTTASGEPIYTDFPWDAGMAADGVMGWEYDIPVQRDSGAVAMIFKTPPVDLPDYDIRNFDGPGFVFGADLEALNAELYATNDTYTEAPMDFMTPVNETDMSALYERGAKLIAYHGVSDAIFSISDTMNWFDGLAANHQESREDFAKLYPVAGMGHCRGGYAADQFDLISPLVAWVEQGEAPADITAMVRGSDNAGGANEEIPGEWSATRSRPLCAYPTVARYDGMGDIEDAASFSCQ